MKLEDFSTSRHLLLKSIAGSRAYGLALPSSDTDIRGVFVHPAAEFYRMDGVSQVNNPSNDIVYYELRRFFELLYKNNPNILELLAVPDDCILYKHPLLDLLDPGLFLSKQCKDTFAGYAFAQVKRARGLNKKIVNPLPEERMTILDFCFVIARQGTIPLKKWLAEKGFRQEDCGLIKIDHARDIYGICHPGAGEESEPDSGCHADGELVYRGIMRKENANGVSLSRVPKGAEPAAYMSFNKDAYTKYCRDYKAYWDWVKMRNEARYADTVAHGKNYDAKNMMHTFRLLDMAEDIARHGKVIVRRENRQELLDIRAGKFEYQYLVERAETKMAALDELFAQCDLPQMPDREKINRLLVEIRIKFYEHPVTEIALT